MNATVKAGRRSVQISRPDKPLFPCGITKLELACYYEQVGSAMLNQISGRPLNLERFPDGIEGHRIIQQHASAHFPDWLERVRVKAAKGTVEHVVANRPAALVYLAGQACITFHPWLSRADMLDRPDRFVVDLDPAEHGPAAVRKAALMVGGVLRELELEPFVMSTGSRGYHVVVPLRRAADFAEVREFTRRLSQLVALREPGTFTIEQRKAKRGGRILVDVMRNAYAHTAVGAYSVRPRPGAPVATPLEWEEMADSATRADRWTLRTVPKRLEELGDPWAALAGRRQTLGSAQRRLRDALAEAGA